MVGSCRQWNAGALTGLAKCSRLCDESKVCLKNTKNNGAVWLIELDILQIHATAYLKAKERQEGERINRIAFS
jgi:hypothetical protein